MPEVHQISNTIVPFVFVLLLSFHFWVTTHHDNFLQCLSLTSENSTSISKVIYTQNNSSYSSVLKFSVQNLRFSAPTTPKPLAIITPLQISHIQTAIKCSRIYGLQIRTRSGGHDYEGLSYVSVVQFLVIDLVYLSSINIDVEDKTAWVEAGATIGELCCKIAEKSRTLAFPVGGYPTVGVGGHFSGGGYGMLLRKYGVAADHIVDAHLIDVEGRFLNRKSMGEDLFWAIRGGGGASFGVIVSWKIKLVDVPSTVTVCNVQPTLEPNTTKIIPRWQYVADKLPKDLFLMVFSTSLSTGEEGKRTIQAVFPSLFLGGVDRLLPLMQERYPELGLVKEDCTEMAWIESVVLFAPYRNGDSLDVLLERNTTMNIYFKFKSDYVKEPMPEIAFERIYQMFQEKEAEAAQMVLVPFGGKMSEILDSEIPFPYRAGNIYIIEQVVFWNEAGSETSQSHINWIRRLHKYLRTKHSPNFRQGVRRQGEQTLF